jgi:pimeloyl-ACP methyl ester carboxylesterase
MHLTSYAHLYNLSELIKQVIECRSTASARGDNIQLEHQEGREMSEGNDVSVVLAHGAWADGSSWHKVIDALQAKSVTTIAAPLPLTSLPDDVVALDRASERVEGQLVLVGHAYAGAVIGSIRNKRVKSLIYVAGLAPAEGETVADVFYRATPHPQAPKLAPDSHGLIWLPSDAFAAAFAPNATREEHAWLSAVQRPISPACISVAVERPLWEDRPSWFLIAERDRMIAPETQRFMADRMKARVRSHPVDHTPIVTASAVVVDLIMEAVHDDSAQSLKHSTFTQER